MNDHVHVACPRCNTTNRVRRDLLDAGPKCGNCKEALLPGEPFDLGEASFDRHVSASDLPLVVDFWAPWCAPCRMMAPAYAEAAARLAPEVRLAKLDTEALPEIAARLRIRSIPTLVVFRNGREVARQSGAMDLPGLIGWVKTNA